MNIRGISTMVSIEASLRSSEALLLKRPIDAVEARRGLKLVDSHAVEVWRARVAVVSGNTDVPKTQESGCLVGHDLHCRAGYAMLSQHALAYLRNVLHNNLNPLDH